MDTKTLKQMALALLAKDDLTGSEIAWLNHATSEQAYPGVREQWVATGTTTPILVLNYATSVDACLTLFPECDLRIKQAKGAIEVGWLWTVDWHAWEQHLQAYHKRLEIALLKVYWLQQPD